MIMELDREDEEKDVGLQRNGCKKEKKDLSEHTPKLDHIRGGVVKQLPRLRCHFLPRGWERADLAADEE